MEAFMTCCARIHGRRLYRDTDRAMIGGVCAGLARHLGFNLKVTRFLAVIAFLCAMPFAIIAYLAAVLLIPPLSHAGGDEVVREGLRKEKLREEILRARPTINEVRSRYAEMDERLARIEKYVTSSRFELDQEFRRL
jgi:phage shock protein C